MKLLIILLSILFIQKTQDPLVQIVQPSVDEVFVGNQNITIKANISSDAPIDHVDFYIDNTVIGTDYSKPYKLTFNSGIVLLGRHPIGVKAVDISGGIGITVSSIILQ